MHLYDRKGNGTVIGTGCGPTFSPDRERLSLEDDGHTGYFLKVRYIITYGGIETIQWKMEDKTEFGGLFHRMKWSNHMDWGTLHGGYSGVGGVLAWNYKTKKMVKLSFFSDDQGRDGRLFIGEPGTVYVNRIPGPLRVAPSKARPSAGHARAYTLLGRRVRYWDAPAQGAVRLLPVGRDDAWSAVLSVPDPGLGGQGEQ
jgi:hypothetical protein